MLPLTLTRSLTVLKRLHLLIEFKTGSFQSSTTLCVVIGGNPFLCKAYKHLRHKTTIKILYALATIYDRVDLKSSTTV